YQPSSPTNLLRTHNNQITVANNGKAKNCRNFSIQGPGLGKSADNPGLTARSKKGAASPAPNPRTIAIACSAGKVADAPRAAPINGPVHGAATNTANTPVPNDERLLALPARFINEWPNSNAPIKLNAITQNNNANAI